MGLIIKWWRPILPEVGKYFMYFFRVCNNSQHNHLRATFRTDKWIYFIWIKMAIGNYREFRKKHKEIQKLDKSFKELLDAYEKETIKKSRQLRDYL